MSDLTELGVRAIRDGVRQGRFSAREVADAFIVKVSRAKALNAFLVETPEHALAAADAADAARAAGATLKPLAGVPIGMKDLFCTAGVPTTAASHILEGFVPPYESAVSANLGVNPSLTITAMAERALALWPNHGEPDPRPALGSAYEPVVPVPPRSPAVPASAPAALTWLGLPG